MSRVGSTGEIADIFNTSDELFSVFTEKSIFFFLFFPLGGKLNFIPSYFSLILLCSARWVGIIWFINYENGLLCHVNEWIQKVCVFLQCRRTDVAGKLALYELKCDASCFI